MFPLKVCLIWSGFILVRFSRDITLKVESASFSNSLQQAVGEVLSSNFFTCSIAYLISNFFMYLIILYQTVGFTYYVESPTKTIKPFVNDRFIYYWFFLVYYSLMYAAQFLVLQKNKLNFQIGVYRADPISYLQSLSWRSVSKESLSISVFVSATAPVLYYFSRKLIYRLFLFPLMWLLNLNHQLPKFAMSFKLYLYLSILSFLTTLSYEILNKVYNAYTMVGCLNILKPLSSYSEDPFQTLLSGLKDLKNPFVRLTAFQELAYYASSTNPADREIFYKNGTNWTLLLEQCSILIKNSCKAIKSDLTTKSTVPSVVATELPKLATERSTIFGNSGQYKSPFQFDDDLNSADQQNMNGMFETKPMDSENLYFKPTTGKKLNQQPSAKSNQSEYSFLTFLKNVQGPELFNKLITTANSSDNKFLAKLRAQLTEKSKIPDKLIAKSLAREADKRIPNKAILGNSIIAISEVLLHAKKEDKKSVTIGTLTETLTLLTKVYKATSDFMSNPPVKPLNDESNNNVIVEINNLTLSYFFKLVIMYNSILNDLILSPEVFKFAKWCIDSAIEEKRNQEFDLTVDN
ncbi:hypothetical protein CANARDRAFT_205235 [[Candida] arabinofermentans NRRL YB-2248]|uniref:Nucleoporin NDC1 n=1 Tax=[Candida] arabinofermentans NRRL YB-2248 TaxID=983967 RepID=A0A1E4T7S4_9ASCO|nr:hypothetical protein CANARDRAFT_205235 [[Candida] arabinofermentans NRRL YB-2248]